jgi:hypothetical protein
MSEFPLKYTVGNKTTETLQVIIEPWAEEFTLRPGSVLSVAILHDQLGLLETEMGPGYLTMWLWKGCRAEVSLDDKDQTPGSLSIPVPF